MKRISTAPLTRSAAPALSHVEGPALSQVEGKSLKSSAIMRQILRLRCTPGQNANWVSIIPVISAPRHVVWRHPGWLTWRFITVLE